MKKIFLKKYFPASWVANIRKKYVGFGNLMARHSPSIGKDLSNCAFNALIIKYPINYSFNISMKDWCLLTVVSLMLQVEGHWWIRHPRLHANWSRTWQPTRNSLAPVETSQTNE
jgi:hypothetical protein